VFADSPLRRHCPNPYALGMCRRQPPPAIQHRISGHARRSEPQYRVRVSEDGGIIGDEPPVNGMCISLRYRQDFRVTDATQLLDAARRAFLDLYPGSTEADAELHITGAADALFTILEHAGFVWSATETQRVDGLLLGGSRARVVIDEPDPLLPGWNCFRGDEVFAIPTPATDPTGLTDH
jgi:hypothetical protein